MLALVFFGVMFGGTCVTAGYTYVQAVRHREAEIRRQVRDLTEVAATMVDVELHESLVRPEQRDSAEYRRALAPLVKFHRINPDIQYLWTTRVTADGSQSFMLQTSTDEEIRGPQLALGRPQALLEFLKPDPITEAGRRSVPALRGGQAVVLPGIYADVHGRYIEARAPLRDRAGNFLGYLGVDYALDSYFQRLNEVRATGLVTLALALLVSLLVATLMAEMRRQSFSYLEQVRQAEAEMRAQRDEATKANGAKSELLAIATHDLKNPLSVIAGMAGLMLQEKRSLPKSPEAQEDVETLETIHASAQHLSEIVRGILMNEGLEHGGLRFEPVPVDLSAVGEMIVRFNAPAAKRKGLVLQVDLAPKAMVVGDAKLLREALDNYLSNGIKYSPANRTVTVSTRLVAGAAEVEFSVLDQGPGLSAADQTKLYRKFQKLSARPTAGETSSGLGLSIVKTIVELHHGSFGCESTLGQGARFWLRLPVAPPLAASVE